AGRRVPGWRCERAASPLSPSKPETKKTKKDICMAQFFEVHPDNPHTRLLKKAVSLLERGGIAAVPTDSSYALGCHLNAQAAPDSLRRIRGVDDKHHLAILC